LAAAAHSDASVVVEVSKTYSRHITDLLQAIASHILYNKRAPDNLQRKFNSS